VNPARAEFVEALRKAQDERYRISGINRAESIVQRFTLSGTSKSVFSALAVLPILAIPPGIAAVCALPEPKIPLFYWYQQA
jgi:hypothetical protein